MGRGSRLHLDLDDAGSRAGEGLDEEVRSLDHQVRLDGELGDPSHRLDRSRSEGEVGDEMPIHDIDLDPVGAALDRLPDLLTEAREVRGQDRGDDLDALHSLYSPEAARSISHRAPAIIPDGTSPRFAR